MLGSGVHLIWRQDRAGQGRAGARRGQEGPGGARGGRGGGPGGARELRGRSESKKRKNENFGQVPPRNGLEPPRSLKSARWRLPGAPWGRPFEGGPNGQRPPQ